MSSVFSRLYVGNGAFDIVGKRTRWYITSAIILLVCIGSMVFNGFNFGIDFKGGTKISMPSVSASGQAISTSAVEDVYAKALPGKKPNAVQSVGSGASASIQLKSPALSIAEVATLKAALAQDTQPQGGAGAISDSAVSASWGGEISGKALWALFWFFVAVTIFLVFYFEWQMAVGALVAVFHDVIITAGVYSLIGFEVTPATVIGLLTILGFSLYDTVVVFDKVKENTRGLLGLTRRTYAEASNLALNQTLMRSINTSLIALLPVIGLLVVGVGILGVGTLQDLALVQLVGMFIGALSSIFLATPVLVDLKMRDPKYIAQARRVAARRAKATGPQAAEGIESVDDEALSADLRKEEAYAAAASVPHRTAKAGDARRRPTGKRQR
ncbi:protein translocase subunit SecF [Lentzea flaviverrucosa]|uniref:Protein-export membrane protein SecF n=1 Tax=Lentzea flaviverrucosa TaxID=200379 RepID=A0A1H9XVL6_9PSEU|nr:protein translocase subunit SecF [Lentzea flaviverrucosa]RDI18288.1 preprotein translocase subunit SecF [Lentzea flaviverrucosa]SES50225.1 preprotein translocase subunit SecF [Lentzea flaviverrucosa]